MIEVVNKKNVKWLTVILLGLLLLIAFLGSIYSCIPDETIKNNNSIAISGSNTTYKPTNYEFNISGDKTIKEYQPHISGK